MTERKKPKFKLRLPLQAYLLYLLLLTVMFTGVTIARFTTSTTSSTGTRVAAFHVSASANTPTNPEAAVLDCASADTYVSYDLTVTSESEVKVKYDVIVKLDKVLDAGVTMTLGGNAPASVNANTYTFTDVGTIAAGGGENTHALVFTADADMLTTDYITSVQITVHAEQVD